MRRNVLLMLSVILLAGCASPAVSSSSAASTNKGGEPTQVGDDDPISEDFGSIDHGFSDDEMYQDTMTMLKENDCVAGISMMTWTDDATIDAMERDGLFQPYLRDQPWLTRLSDVYWAHEDAETVWVIFPRYDVEDLVIRMIDSMTGFFVMNIAERKTYDPFFLVADETENIPHVEICFRLTDGREFYWQPGNYEIWSDFLINSQAMDQAAFDELYYNVPEFRERIDDEMLADFSYDDQEIDGRQCRVIPVGHLDENGNVVTEYWFAFGRDPDTGDMWHYHKNQMGQWESTGKG